MITQLSRKQIYTVLILISAALMLGRIIAVNRTDMLEYQKYRINEVNKRYDALEKQLREDGASEEKLAENEQTRKQRLANEQRELPVFSANDRSRWNTIRVLVEPEMRVQRTVKQPDGTEKTETVWYAIDKAQNQRGWDTIDMVKHDLPDQPGEGLQPGGGYLYSSKPPLLPTVMSIPYAILYHASGKKLSLADEPHLVVRIVLIICNLLPMVFAWFLLAKLIDRFGTTDWGRIFSVAFVCFGTFLSTFAVTLNNHTSCMICVTIALYTAVRIVYDKEIRLRYFAIAGFFSVFAVACDLPALLFCTLIGFWIFCERPVRMLIGFMPAALIVTGAFFATNYIAHQTLLPAYSQPSWYFYEYERGGKILDCYWKNPQGFDGGEANRSDYVFHTTIGHHGLFSLTPVWALSLIGIGIWLFKRPYRNMALIFLVTSIIVFAFYMMLPIQQRNYGGNTSALRWLFWLAPLWSVALVGAADFFSRSVLLRLLALLCLIVSIMSATYPLWNPWSMPWTYNVLQAIHVV